MSDRSKSKGVEFVPVVSTLPVPPPAHAWLLLCGVMLPATVIVVELATRMCAQAFFDPLPTVWHVLAVGIVPATNLWMWGRLRQPIGDSEITSPWQQRTAALACGAAIAIAALYSLLFLPVMPLAIVAVLVGIGVLPFAPLAALVAGIKLNARLQATSKSQPPARWYYGGMAAGLAALLALDAPMAATRLGIQWASSNVPEQRERGLRLIRAVGNHDLLLRLCYDTAGRPSGLLSALVILGGNGLFQPLQREVAQSPAEIREIYYRVTGTPFNAKPPPFISRRFTGMEDFAFDADHGGAQVGGRIKGLDIVSSRIDASISGNDAVAYLEWILEFRNTSLVDREARLQLALPPGGVVSRATLWVNGEEREAAYGGRAEVRAAYQRVAVQQRRDPLLVTTKGADRVLAQAFPVPRNGGTIKFKLGITAPLELRETGKAQLVLPAIVERNFSFTSDVAHQLWIESRQPLSASRAGLAATRLVDGRHRIAGALTDVDLARTRQTITVERNAETGKLASRIGEGSVVVQEPATAERTRTLMLLVDGSVRMRPLASQIAAALRGVPPDTRLGVVVVAEPIQRIELAPATDAHKQAIARLLQSVSFVGGQDNAPALAQALMSLESEPGAALLWVHGPQPIGFRQSSAQLAQATGRLSRLPRIVLYATEPGPNELLPDAPWGWAAGTLPRTTAPETDLVAWFGRELGTAPSPSLKRSVVDNDEGAAKGSEHIARMWAKDRVLELMRQGGANRAEAVALAVQYRLITPVSGAVVLETQQDYDESRLTPVSQATVPTIPEPHEWALLLLASCCLGWLLWHRRRQEMAPA